MSQNPFGAPAPRAEPEPLPAEPIEDKTRKGLLVGGLAGLVALVVAGGAFLVLGGDDEVEAALVAAPKVPAASSPTTEPPAPLPTLAEFNGRNPFKAKIVESSGGGGTAAADATSTSSTPTSGTISTANGGSSGGLVVGSGGTVISMPGEPGPAGPAGAAGGAGAAGAAGTDGAEGPGGKDGRDAAALYGVLVDVETLGDGTLVGHFALGVGSDFELSMGEARDFANGKDGKLTTDPAGEAVTAPATWVQVIELRDDPDGNAETDDDVAVIQFGDRVVQLTQWDAEALL